MGPLRFYYIKLSLEALAENVNLANRNVAEAI